jgi:hypothetical protein
MSGMGSLINVGGVVGIAVFPVLEKAPDFWMKSARAAMPLLVPRIVGRTMYLDAFFSIFRCWSYLGHSLRIWLLVSMVSLSHGQVIGSGDRGKNV